MGPIFPVKYTWLINFSVFSLLLVLACNKIQPPTNLFEGHIKVIGHAGVGLREESKRFPANSQAAIERALFYYGAEGIEVDVQLSSDDKLYLYHDELLSSRTNGSGCISELNSTYLKELYYTGNEVRETRNHKLYTLSELLQLLSYDLSIPIFLDIRLGNSCRARTYAEFQQFKENIVNQLARLFQEMPNRNIKVISGEEEFLTLIKEKLPFIATFLEREDSFEAIEKAVTKNFQGIININSRISKSAIATAHQHGLETVIFNTNSINGNIEAINKGPDYIQTDNILALQSILTH